MSIQPIRVTVWGENAHEKTSETVRAVYPDGMHTVIAAGIREYLGDGAVVRTATLEQDEHGLTDEVLGSTDVLTWWGHMAHGKVEDAVVDKVYQRVLNGMGLIVLHSGHFSKIFRKLMGTSCALRWREDPNERELVWNVRPGHPITKGIGPVIVVPHQEMYGEYFDIPQPDEQIFISSFTGGEVFRSGCCFTRGQGRIFYFSPGHETFPVYYQTEIKQVIANAVGWAYRDPASSPVFEITKAPNAPTGWFEKSGND
ncbi:MAG: ThuA domain-containing protein [Cytophagales bacterium]|nr:ThuA domain-containing protein [Armatimonadota bacterium]